MKVLFISEKTLKENTVINENVDFVLLRPTIQLVQDQYIQTIIGTPLYDELKQQISGSNLSVDNQLLLDDYIEPALLYMTLSESTIPLLYKLTNKAIVEKNSDNSNPIPFSTMSFLKNDYKQKGQWYLTRLDEFLCDQWPRYPKFKDARYPDIIPSRRPYTTNIYLGAGVPGWVGKLPQSYRYPFHKFNTDYRK